ncbi:MAG: S9 family peptidase [Ignavibacteriae bacterium]|nr:S9 family peptidase [Ignavibacteriota bacterium]NOG99032.1 S9 family peptidase [Ignavibacteriota bacterium]
MNIIRIKFVQLSLILSLIGGLGCTSQNPKVPLIPIEDFFKNPVKDKFRISPSGEKLAFLKSWENRMNIFVQNIGGEKTARITNSAERDIKYFFWANDNRIVYLQDSNGDENYHLFAVDPDGSHHKDLTPFKNTTVKVIDELRDSENEMIISLNKRKKTIFDAYRLNIKTGELKLTAKNPGKVTRWMTDNKGIIRIAVITDGVNMGILYRDNENEEFKPTIVTDFKNELTPLFFTPDNKNIYACSNIGRDKCAIIKYDVTKGREVEEVYSHPDVDVWNLIRSNRNELVGVVYTTWKKQIHFFDEDRKILQKKLERQLANLEVVIVNADDKEKKFIVRTFSDKNLGAFYYYDEEKKYLEKLSDVSPWLKAENMAHMKPITYKSRDGKTINGYLTLPRNVKAENLPVVINPHGGPWTRDYWGFNKEVQFLANRGYAVLQMNYRGSTGYGKDFWQAGFKEWGGTIQNDIADGVNWLIKQSIADPKRIAIYGSSFGGYAALAGLVNYPELYACGVSKSGIHNIFAFLNSIPPYWQPLKEMIYEMVGDPVKDSSSLKLMSPFFNIDKIKDPVLIAQGGNDPKVPVDTTIQFIKKLEENGISVDYFYKEKEGHGFKNEENKIEFYGVLESFLAKHLLGRKSNLTHKN